MRLRRVFARKYAGMMGDCEECGHSIIYHIPIVGCTRCSCDEFH